MQKIKWDEWDKTSFEKAAKEKKPILLDIHGVWCHWCHVMDNNTYSNPEVIEMVNENFIPIKVDTDKRPDINKRYNMGGWPSTVFLTPTGQIITGTSYAPPDTLKLIMLRVVSAFKEIKQKEVRMESKKLEVKKDANISQKIIEAIIQNMIDNFDFEYGGFGVPKFPMADAINLAFYEYKKTNKKDFLILARVTLDNMKGIFDNIEGGFYRYSVTQQWNEPHYEKLLETNAGVIKNYLRGYGVTKKEEYKNIAIKSLDYIKNNLTNGEGAFFGSQDADEEYYKLNKVERKRHSKPNIDKNIYTDFSSMMISTYCYAFKVLNDSFYRDFALKSVKFLVKNNYQKGMFHYFDGRRKFLHGNLADNIYFINALIDTYKIANNKELLEFAENLNKFVLDNFMDKNDKCFFDKIKNPTDVGFLKYRDKSITENSIMAIILIRLAKLNNNNDYLKMAENILKAFYSGHEKYNIYEAVYGLAVSEFLSV